MFPQVAPKFFKSRAEGRKNLGKDPSKPAPAAKASAAAASGGSVLGATVNYVITLNGKEHRVTVAPEK
jgi:methylmalonyl-CoA carboxyltransferase 5S subunit